MTIRQVDDTDNFVVDCAGLGRNGTGKLQSLAGLITPQDRRQILKKLFRGDAAGFDKLLAQLERASSWSAAHRMLEQHFYRAQISPYNHAATFFSDLVYKRYFPEG
jgi:hypothetical protein